MNSRSRRRGHRPKTISTQGLTGQRGINFIENVVLGMDSRWTPSGANEVGIDGYLINWLEAQGIQRHLAHSVSHNFRDRSVALDLCQQTPPRWPMTADCHGSVCNSGEPVTMWNPCQIATQNVNSERRRHKKRAHPEAPITMHTLPVRARAGFTAVATISFPVVLASRHLFSISREYSPRRAAWLQRAR
jgi:hypothetical protein